MNVKKLTAVGCLTSLALIIFVVEAQIPPLFIPGIKPGLSNIAVLVAMAYMGRREAFCVLVLRIILGSIFTGTPISFIFSITGGLFAYAAMSALIGFFGKEKLWITSVIGALFHNLGQLTAAYFVMGTAAVFGYAPFLAIAAVISGAFTGLAAQFTLRLLPKPK